MRTVLDGNAFHEGGDSIADGHLEKNFLVLEIGIVEISREQCSWEEKERAYKAMQLMKTVNHINALGGIARHWSRSRPVTVFSPGEGECDEAVDNILLPSRIYDGRVGRAVFCYGLECCPMLFNGIEGSLLVSVACGLMFERPLQVILYV